MHGGLSTQEMRMSYLAKLFGSNNLNFRMGLMLNKPTEGFSKRGDKISQEKLVYFI
jgi:hypothetical protein